jgi:hypothetical protein
MVHEYSHTTPAVKGILSFATFSERKHMLKTLKRKIALVAVAGLGAGLISVAPASAVVALANLNLVQTGSTLAVKTGNAGAIDTAAARAGVQTIKISEDAAIVAADAYHLAVSTTACNAADATLLAGMATIAAGTTVPATAGQAIGTAAANTTTVNTYTAGKIVVITPSASTTGAMVHTLTTAALTAGTWNICADPSPADSFATDGISIATLTVVAGGAAASVSWASNVREVSAAAVDYASDLAVKDSSGVATVLVGDETIVLDVTPQTGVATTQVIFTDASISADEITATTGTAYAVNLDGAPAGATGSTVAGTTYSLTAQLVSSGNAIGAPATGTYTRVANTAGLTGALSFTSDTAGTAVASLSTAPNVASTGYFVKAVDSTGAVIKGVTINLALTGVTGATSVTSDTTAQTGFTSSRTATPTAAGTGVITASINAGTSTISKTLAITSVGFGATAATAAGVTATAVNGNGLVAGATAGTTWTASRSTTSLSLKISGLDASKTIRLEGAGTATGVKVAGIAATAGNAVIDNATDLAFVTADAAGVATVAVTLTSATNNQTAIIGVSADGAGVDDITITVTFTDAATALTTSPATATTSFVAVSSSQTITATVADQYKNPVVGGSVLLTNTSAPAAVTLATAASVNVKSDGTASLTAPIASTAGTYVYTVQARDANGANVGTLSTITYTATTDGAPGSVTLTSGGSEAALGSFTVWTSTNGVAPLSATTGTQTANVTADASLSTDTAAQALAKVGDHVVITVKVSNAAGTGIDNVKVDAKGSDGVFLATTAPTSGTTQLKDMTSTSATSTGGGVATIHAVATKVGTNTVTFTVGSKTATATFISKQGLLIQSIARTVTMGSATVAVTGGAITQAVATVKDAFGNPVAGVALTGTISGVAGRFAGGARSFAGTTDAAGTVTFEITGNVTESGAGTLTVAGTDAAANITTADFRTGDLSGNLSTLGKEDVSSVTATLAVTAGVADSSSAQIKTDVATANAAVKSLATQVTVLQASVATLIDSLTTQIASLMKSVSALSKAVAKLQKK